MIARARFHCCEYCQYLYLDLNCQVKCTVSSWSPLQYELRTCVVVTTNFYLLCHRQHQCGIYNCYERLWCCHRQEEVDRWMLRIALLVLTVIITFFFIIIRGSHLSSRILHFMRLFYKYRWRRRIIVFSLSRLWWMILEKNKY